MIGYLQFSYWPTNYWAANYWPLVLTVSGGSIVHLTTEARSFALTYRRDQ